MVMIGTYHGGNKIVGDVIHYIPMKLQIRIKEVAQSRGIQTAYQLQKRARLAPSTAARLYRNKVRLMTIETLEKLLDALNCDAGELFVRPTRKKSRSIRVH